MKKYLMILVLIIQALSAPITPIPLEVVYDAEKAALGQALFFDPKLSSDGTVSCASCHFLPGSGANPIAYSIGVGGEEGNFNTPTVLNAAFNFRQFWDGRAKTLKDQVAGPIHNPVEMNSSMQNVRAYVVGNANYAKRFSKLYPEGPSIENIAHAIAEFERALFTPNSRFDQYLRGDESALSAKEKKGYELFKKAGCISCHNGRNIGGNLYQKIGVIVPYDHDDKGQLGRFEVTKRDADKLVFKVPSLRNISKTAPYFHDGSVATLRQAILDMFEHQLGRQPKTTSVDAIEAFLRTLDGDTPAILKVPHEK